MKHTTILFTMVTIFTLMIGQGCVQVPPPADSDNDTSDGSGQTIPDASDLCPDDPDKTDPGICGCGIADTDTDGDGVADCNDECPEDASTTAAGPCGCGLAETDTDADGTPDCNDECPDDANKTSAGQCGCGAAETDTDADGTPNCADECPDDPNKIIPGECGCDQVEVPGCDNGGGSLPPIDGPTFTLNLNGGVTLELIRIPDGTYDMGSDDTTYSHLERSRPVHSVTISQPFYMSKYEITQEQWQAVMNTTPWSGQSWVIEQSDAAATYISWDDCQTFCQAIKDQTGYTVRLPSEAKWEYACRAGSTTEYTFGDVALPDLDLHAWYDASAWDIGEGYAHAVGQKLANAFGLYDMHGNVNEWCEDEWHADYTGAPADGSAWVDENSSLRIIRGGSWADTADDCRSAVRYGSSPSTGSDLKGLRLTADPG